MSAGCNHDVDFDGASAAYKRALWAVIAINGVMFLVEGSAGFAGQSMALKADALDFAGDTATYAMSLMVIGMALHWRARAALVKGISLLLMGLGVLGLTAYRVIVLNDPSAEIMGSIAALALVANIVSVLILMKFRDGDANVRSVWLCSRNDAIGNVAVIAAAGVVAVSGSPWPDLAVAAFMAWLFTSSAVSIIKQARVELQSAPVAA
ncbi:cation transporter [Pyruvatibacter sp.]|uniref:cation transporter n=1 Tax=Pyruvatibacter sp. TaxID=1981328 RepID=UPI003263B9ED